MVKIREGYITKKDLQEIKTNVVNNNMFPWYYYPEPVYGFQKNYPCLTHTLLPRYNYDTDEGYRINSDYYFLFTDIIKKLCKKHKIKIKRILRAALNYTTYFKQKYSNTHFDHTFPHTNIIIYLNKFTKGSTFLFKETYKSNPAISNKDRYDPYKAKELIKEMTAEEGKYIIFPGENYHAAGSPGKDHEVRMICICTIEEDK